MSALGANEGGGLAAQQRDLVLQAVGGQIRDGLPEGVGDDIQGHHLPGPGRDGFAGPHHVLAGAQVQDPLARGQVGERRAEPLVALFVRGHRGVEVRVVDGVLPDARPQREPIGSLGFRIHLYPQGHSVDDELVGLGHASPLGCLMRPRLAVQCWVLTIRRATS